MEVRLGYKQTEVGVIPQEWSYRLLGAEIKEMTDFVAAGSFESLRNNVHVYDTPHFALYVRLYDLRLGLGHSLQKYVDEAGYKFLSKSNLYGHEILVANIGANVGEAFLMPSGVGHATIAPNMIVVRSDDSKIQFEYLYFYIKSEYGQARINELIAGSGHPKINKTDLKTLKVVVPPLGEQETIAEALGDTDALIDSLEYLVVKKRHLKQGAMQELLTGVKRLPGFAAGSRYKQTTVGILPEDWDTPQLGVILKSMQLGGNYKNGERVTNWPLIKMGNLGRGNITLSKIEFIDQSQPPASRDRLWRDDVLFNTRNTLELVGKVALWRDELPQAYFNSNIMRMKFDEARVSSKRFMTYILNTPASLSRLRGIATGTTSVAAIYSRDLVKVEVPLPNKAEQLAIATVLSEMDAEIDALEIKLTKARQLKQGMMQELLTGRIRLV